MAFASSVAAVFSLRGFVRLCETVSHSPSIGPVCHSPPACCPPQGSATPVPPPFGAEPLASLPFLEDFLVGAAAAAAAAALAAFFLRTFFVAASGSSYYTRQRRRREDGRATNEQAPLRVRLGQVNIINEGVIVMQETILGLCWPLQGRGGGGVDSVQQHIRRDSHVGEIHCRGASTLCLWVDQHVRWWAIVDRSVSRWRICRPERTGEGSDKNRGKDGRLFNC